MFEEGKWKTGLSNLIVLTGNTSIKWYRIWFLNLIMKGFLIVSKEEGIWFYGNRDLSNTSDFIFYRIVCFTEISCRDLEFSVAHLTLLNVWDDIKLNKKVERDWNSADTLAQWSQWSRWRVSIALVNLYWVLIIPNSFRDNLEENIK